MDQVECIFFQRTARMRKGPGEFFEAVIQARSASGTSRPIRDAESLGHHRGIGNPLAIRQEGHNLGGRPKVYHNHCREDQQICRSNVATSSPKREQRCGERVWFCRAPLADGIPFDDFRSYHHNLSLFTMVMILAPRSTCRMYCGLWWTQ